MQMDPFIAQPTHTTPRMPGRTQKTVFRQQTSPAVQLYGTSTLHTLASGNAGA